MARSPKREREFLFTEDDFERVRGLILRRAGIHLSDNKQEMVYSRLARRVRALGDRSIADYLDRLNTSDAPEWESFVNALTTNLTAFFREKHHFDILVDHLNALEPDRRLRVWCCAASTGEEPYSIAMALRDGLSGRRQVEIIASDVDTAALATARAGVYGLDRVSKLDRSLLRRHFFKGVRKNDGRVRVKPEVRKMVRFEAVNLLDSRWPIEGPLDAIFCRNVFIYFSRDTQSLLLERFHRLLASDGLFFAGHSESLLSHNRDFRSMGKTVFAPLGKQTSAQVVSHGS